MKEKKLIRGVIYDDPVKAEENICTVVDALSWEVDNLDEFVKMVGGMNACPTRDEFLVSSCIDCIIRPEDGYENMIIPSNMVCDKLYKDLKKIDIGEDIYEGFINSRVADYQDKKESEENSKFSKPVVIENNDGRIAIGFHNEEDLLTGIAELHKHGIFSDNQVEDLMNQLKNIA